MICNATPGLIRGSDIIVKEEVLDGGDTIIKHRTKRDFRIQASPHGFDNEMMTEETVLPSKTFKRCQWGPFSWYREVS